MDTLQIFSLSDAARALGKDSNHRLLRALIKVHGIPTRKIGHMQIMDGEGFQRLEKAVREWDQRPRLSESLASAS